MRDYFLRDLKEKLFLKRFIKDNGCWIWKGGKTKSGYGAVWNHELWKNESVHIVSARLFLNSFNEELEVLHSCDNKLCFNPEHLFQGTQLDNMQDKVSKDRQAKRESHGMSKLSENQVKEIRELKGSLTRQQIADRFNIFPSTVGKIHRRIIWK